MSLDSVLHQLYNAFTQLLGITEYEYSYQYVPVLISTRKRN